MVKPRRSAISSTSTWATKNLVGNRLRLSYNHQVHHRGGSTFPEIMVAGFCLLLLLGFIAPLLGRTARVLQRSDQDATAQHEALIGVQRFFSEAAYSDGRSFSLYEPDSTICSFLSGRNPQSSNPPSLAMDDFYSLGSFSPHINWKRFLVIYHDAAKSKLCYKEFAYASNEIARIDNDHLSALAYRNDSATHTITNNLIHFQVESPRQGQAWISVITERKWDQTFRSQLRFMVTMRN